MKLDEQEEADDDAALAIEKFGFAVAQLLLKVFAIGEDEVAGPIETVFGGLGDADSLHLRQGVDSKEVPSGHGHALGAELDDVFGLDLVEQHAVDLVGGGGLGGLGAAQELQDAGHPRGRLLRERHVDGVRWLSQQMIFDGTGDAVFSASGRRASPGMRGCADAVDLPDCGTIRQTPADSDPFLQTRMVTNWDIRHHLPMLWQKIKSLFGSVPTVDELFKEEWTELLETNVPLYSRLPEDLKSKLHERIARFITSTRFEGCNELELTEEMILTVAAQACMLVLNREGDPYPELKTVYLYPTTFSSVQRRQDGFGIVTEGVVHRLGESWSSGTVVLAWDSVAHGAKNPNDAQNVTFHEFAHQLDHESGDTDGAPILPCRESYLSWARVFGENYAEVRERIDAGRPGLIDPYGATEPAEFFAVATETFFEKPRQLFKKHSDLYTELADFYGVDPKEWITRANRD